MSWWLVLCGVAIVGAIMLLVVLFTDPPAETDDEDDVIVDDLRLSTVAWPQMGSAYGDLDEEPQR
jgi:hypothetical protein